MPDSLQITSGVNGDHWEITAIVVDPVVLPSEIFIYENDGTSDLGKYIGVCNLSELLRFRKWENTPIPVFGNAYVRYQQAKILLPLGDPATVTKVVNNMVSTAKTLKVQLLAAAESTSIIPL